MSKIRAYKIAEELGIDRHEFLKRAAEVGIELRSPMMALDEEQVAEVRRRLGAGSDVKREEKRLGTSIIRRRRRIVAPPPEPKIEEKPGPVDEAPVVEEEPEPAEPVPLEPAAEAPEPLAAGEAEGAPVTEPEPESPAVLEASREPSGPAAAASTVAARGGAEAREGEQRAAPGKRMVRRQAIQGIQLREQETLARMLRGNVQSQLERRRQIVEQQSRIQPRRRRAVGQTPPRKIAPPPDRRRALKLEGPIPIQELSRRMGVKLHELLQRAESLGQDLERADFIDVETAALIATDLGFEVETVEEEPAAARVAGAAADLAPRPPVVTVMGHVDHGKTSLLDFIRKTNVVGGESGGITQHIGAYKVQAGGQEITFLDTPGHEAFTHMRARGARVTDIAVLVVAADDGIMPQTVEAISHAKAAGVPILVAINKIDRPDANAQRVKQGLLEHELVSEEFGGDTICVEVSATKGTNVDKLLEMIGLQAEILELQARATGPAVGVVLESQLDRGRGPLASILVTEGVLERGDTVVVGTSEGRVRLPLNERGETLKRASPSTPVQVVGLSSVPEAGEELLVARDEREAKALVERRLEEDRRKATARAESPTMDVDQLFQGLTPSEGKELRVVLKADVHGTMEAIRDSMEKLSTDKATLKVIHLGVGAITESDVMLALASQATIVGFRVRPEPAARKAAEREGVDLRTYEIVYDALDDVTKAMQGLLPPKITEKLVAHAEVRQLFPIPRVGTVAGCFVAEGTFARPNPVRVVRDGVVVYKGRVGSLRRFKENVREVQQGLECGISVENFNDVKVGDVIESYLVEESPATL